MTTIIILARHEVAAKYCDKMGWDMNDLTMGQVMEIRATKEWQDPLKETEQPRTKQEQQ